MKKILQTIHNDKGFKDRDYWRIETFNDIIRAVNIELGNSKRDCYDLLEIGILTVPVNSSLSDIDKITGSKINGVKISSKERQTLKAKAQLEELIDAVTIYDVDVDDIKDLIIKLNDKLES